MAGSVPDIPGPQVPPGEATHLQREVATLLERNSISFPGSQPISFSRRHIEEELLNEDYFVCEKSDGVRCLMYLTSENNEERVFLITRMNEYFWIPDLHFPLRDNVSSFHVGSLLDGELVKSKTADGSEELRYLIFDCLALDGKSLISRTLDKRLGFLRKELYAPYQNLCIHYPEDIKIFPFKCDVKPMERSYGLQKVFYELIPRLKHVSDGLVFTASERPYVFGTDDKILKWKPLEENTIDFQLILEFPLYTDPDLPHEEATYPDYDSKPICHLNVWHGSKIYKPFDEMYITDEEWDKLKALNEPLDERIVECYKDSEGRWRYLRFRDDKESGNHVTVVHKVLESIADAVSKDELIGACTQIRERWKERERLRVQQHPGIIESLSKRNSSVTGSDLNSVNFKRVKTADEWN